MSLTHPRFDSSSKPRCAIIQLSTLSDLLQNLMALRAVKQLYPELDLTLVVRESHAHILRPIVWIKEVIGLPEDKILKPVMDREEPLSFGLQELAKWIKPLIQERWDFVVNWSYSESSSYLTALLPGHIKLGYSRRKDVTLMCVDGWSHYIQAVVQKDQNSDCVDQNIHRTDILTTQLLTALQINLGTPKEPGNSQVTSKDFFSFGTSTSPLANPMKRSVALQLGNWGVENWASLSSYILNRHPEYQILLLGEKSESALADEIINHTQTLSKKTEKIINLVGKTDFSSWASIISQSQWLISDKLASLHLASLMGTRVITLAHHASSWAENGPYGNGHYVLSPISQNSVSPESVYATWAYASQEWIFRKHLNLKQYFEQLNWDIELEDVNIFRSQIRTPDHGGGIQFESMISKSFSTNEWSSKFLGYLARAWYCGWVPPLDQELTRENINPSLTQNMRHLQKATLVFTELCNEAIKTAESLSKNCSRLPSSALIEISKREEIMQLGNVLQNIDKKIEDLGKDHASIRAFSRMSKVLLHHLSGDGLFELSKESIECYRQLHQGAKLLQDWIHFTLSLVKPVVITPEAKIIPLHHSGKTL